MKDKTSETPEYAAFPILRINAGSCWLSSKAARKNRCNVEWNPITPSLNENGVGWNEHESGVECIDG